MFLEIILEVYVNIKIVRWAFVLVAGVTLSANSNELEDVVNKIKGFFVIGDYVIEPKWLGLSYNLRQVKHYNLVDSYTPYLEKVLATESGKFITFINRIGSVNYSQELDKLVVTTAPHFTKSSCEVLEFDQGIYVGKRVTEHLVPAESYRLSLYVDGVVSETTTKLASETHAWWTDIEDVPEVYELALDLRRHLTLGADSYLKLSINTRKHNCDPTGNPIEAGDTVTRKFEIDSDNDTIPDYLYSWFEVKRQQFLSVAPALYLLTE